MSPVKGNLSPVTCHKSQRPNLQTHPLLTPLLCIQGCFTKKISKNQKKNEYFFFALKPLGGGGVDGDKEG